MREAFERHYVDLVRLGTLLAGSRPIAEDLVQEAFLRSRAALTHLEPVQVRPYLRRTMLNLWRNQLRRARLERRYRRLQSLDPEPTLPYEEQQVLWMAVKGLPARQRACVVLRYYEGMSEANTAQILGCSIGTVKSQTHRALRRIREELEDES